MEFISHTLDSVLEQDYDDIEIIIGDDASSDGTIEYIKNYSSSSRIPITLIQHDINVGISKNFNDCLRVINGDIIFLLGGDDVFLKDKISKQVKHFIHLIYNLRSSTCIVVYDDGKSILVT